MYIQWIGGNIGRDVSVGSRRVQPRSEAAVNCGATIRGSGDYEWIHSLILIFERGDKKKKIQAMFNSSALK